MTMFHFQSIPKFDDANDVVPCPERDNDQLDNLAQIASVKVVMMRIPIIDKKSSSVLVEHENENLHGILRTSSI